MLHSTVELIACSATTSLLPFCICHLIVVVLLLRSKSSSKNYNSHCIAECIPSIAEEEVGEYEPEDHELKDFNKEEDELQKKAEEFIEKMNRVLLLRSSSKNYNSHCIAECMPSITEEKVSELIDIEDAEEEDHELIDFDEEDDELRKKAEEFIEKMNRVWRAEKVLQLQVVG